MITSSQQPVRNWLIKAENDLKIGQDEMRTEQPATDMVCYHMQPCVAKYLKAFLAFHQTSFRHTHDLAELIGQCKEIDPEFGELFASQADTLTIYGTEIRYPDDFYIPSREEAASCVQIALNARQFIRSRFEVAGFDLVE